jgi:alcohol dehydrogenase class IV
MDRIAPAPTAPSGNADGLAASEPPAPGPRQPLAMIWHDGAKRMFVHPHLVPRIAVLDPELLGSLPPSVTAAGGSNAISHAVESLLPTFRTPLTEATGRTALAALATAAPPA